MYKGGIRPERALAVFICVFLKVPQPLQTGACHSPQNHKCPHCCHSSASSPHADGGGAVKPGHSCSSAHQASCHGSARCHWLHGSNESRTQTKPKQRHVVSIRWVKEAEEKTNLRLQSYLFIFVYKLLQMACGSFPVSFGVNSTN